MKDLKISGHFFSEVHIYDLEVLYPGKLLNRQAAHTRSIPAYAGQFNVQL